MKILIVDDEPLARERLIGMLTAFKDVELVVEASNGRDAIEQAQRHALSEQAVNVVLLDIAMPVMDGLEAAMHLSHLEPAPAIIFCTAYDAHALQAFEASAVDYLLKPVSESRLKIALERAKKFTGERISQVAEKLPGNRSRTHICARVRGQLKLLPIQDVWYFLAEDKYVEVHSQHGEVLIEESLKTLEDEFADRFVRVHRNCLVATARIAGLKREADGRVMIELRDSAASLEISRRNLPSLRKLVKEL